MTISANIILDSVSEAGVRLTTMELEYPRFIHAETELRAAIARLIAEHVAQPLWGGFPNARSRNFRGWVQHRVSLEEDLA